MFAEELFDVISLDELDALFDSCPIYGVYQGEEE